MLKLNLVHKERSDIDYNLITFPDGEPHIVLGEFNRKERIAVECRICNPTDLFVVLQVADILDRAEVEYEIHIYYLMSMRMDRVISFNEAFSLKVVTDILAKTKADWFEILEPHSERTLNLLKRISEIENEPWEDVWTKVWDGEFIVVFPDKGACNRYIFESPSYERISHILCTKKRNPDTGELLEFAIDNVNIRESEKDKPLMVIDDLCDGGGTFAGIAKLLREKYPDKELNIFVTHMVNSKGIKTLSENYDNVTFTNSYKDWEKEGLPKNVKVINVI